MGGLPALTSFPSYCFGVSAGAASGTGSDSAKAGKSVDATLMPQAVVMRTTAEQTMSVAQTPTETKASLAVPDRVNM